VSLREAPTPACRKTYTRMLALALFIITEKKATNWEEEEKSLNVYL
jgi:hypothetical protein